MFSFALRRLLYAASLAVGASALLFIILESGALGDPVGIRAGKHATHAQRGLARLELGFDETWEPQVLQIKISGLSQPLIWDAIPTQSHDLRCEQLAQLPDARAALGISQATEVQVKILNEKHKNLPLSGIHQSLKNNSVRLQNNLPQDIGWALTTPPLHRFVQQTAQLFRLNFGTNRQGHAIGQDLWTRGRRSLSLTLPAFLLSTLLAISLALGCSIWTQKSNRFWLWSSSVWMSISSLAWILFFRHIFAVKANLFPVAGWESPFFPYLALPIFIWVFLSLWPDFRLYRAFILEQAKQNYIRTAHAKGLATSRVLWKHLLPNALVPILTHAVMALPFLFLGSLLLEQIFQIPGLGSYTVQAILSADVAILRATTFLFTLCFLTGQWLSDLSCAFLDPRLRRSS